jgi:Ca-activated chloride channel homolog
MKQLCKLVIFVSLGLSGATQESAAPAVFLPLIAIGSDHTPTSVTVDSLVITDQKMPVTGATLMRGADLPLELGIMIDASSSQRDAHLDDYLKAARQFMDDTIRGAADRAFFLQFEGTQHATRWLKKEELQDTPFKVELGGGTALYDALGMACKQRMGPRDWRRPTRRVLVLISDGDDNLSHITREDAAAEALRSGAVIFTINPKDSRISPGGEKVMVKLANLTGGLSFNQIDRKAIPDVFATIHAMIDGMYYLSYLPPDTSKRAVHEVEVKPRAPHEKLELSYARKYFWSQ